MQRITQFFGKTNKNKTIAGLLVAMIILLVVLISVLLGKVSSSGGAAGKAKSIAGNYSLESINDNSDDGSAEEALELMRSMGLTATLELNEDGTGTLDVFGEVEDISFDTDRQVLLFNGDEIPYTYKNDEITINQDGTAMVFRK